MGNLDEMFMQLDRIAEQRLRAIELKRYGISVDESNAEAMACEQIERDQAAEYLEQIESQIKGKELCQSQHSLSVNLALGNQQALEILGQKLPF